MIECGKFRRKIVLGILGVSWAAAAAAPAAEVPPAYRFLYDLLNRQLSVVERHFDGRTMAPSVPRYAAELLTANANQGEDILRPKAFQGSLLFIQRFKEMGIQAVWISLEYPMLLPEFPRHREYLDFYKRLAEAIRAQGMEVCMDLGAFFPPSEFSRVDWDYSGETIESFSRKARRQVELIIREIQPDFLGIFNEPDTQSNNTGLDFHVGNLHYFARTVLDGLDRGRTRIGLGAGTWSPIDVFEMIAAETSVDVIDLHLYPILGDLMTDQIDRIAALAAGHGKRLVFGESWLYKAGPDELQSNIAAWDKIFARDVFEFWTPLDERFISALMTICRVHDVSTCNFFWSQYFFGSLPYNMITAGMPTAHLMTLVRKVAVINLLNGTYSALGRAVLGLLRGAAH